MYADCLHGYQNELVTNIIQRPRLGLFVDMGLGKTLVTLTALKELLKANEIKKVLLIAPKAVCSNTWVCELQKWEHLKGITYSIYKAGDKKFNSEVNIIITNCEQVKNIFSDEKVDLSTFDMLVIDESTTFKSYKSQRFKILRKKLFFFKRRLILTGTPIPNGYLDLWPQIFILDQGERLFKSVTHFIQYYFFKINKFEKRIIDSKIPEILDSIKDIVIYKSTDEVDIDLPDLKSDIIYKSLPSDLQGQYNRLKKDFFLQVEFDSLSDNNVVCKTAAVLTNKLLQFSSGVIYTDGKNAFIHNYKIIMLKELIDKHYDENILIVYNYKHEGERIANNIPGAVNLTLDNIHDWNAGNIKIGYFQVNTLARGVNLQQGGRILVWFGFTWNLELYQQTNKRLHRQGQTREVLCYHICTTDMEHRLLKILSKKEATQQQLFDSLKSYILQERVKTEYLRKVAVC